MDRKTLTSEQIKILSKNKNVAHCGSKSVMYSKGFKASALKQYNEEGLSAVEIFQNAGIDLNIIGKRSPNRLMHQWRQVLTTDLDKDNPLNHPNRSLKMLRSQVAYLKAENHFLARIRARKRK